MRIRELHLLSDNLLDTEIFYNTVLEIETDTKSDIEITFIIGETKLCFAKSENIEPVYHIAFDIPNNKLIEAFRWMSEKTTILPANRDGYISYFDLWNAQSFYFWDNNGNLLELIVRLDVENKSDAEFDSSAILYVSEIGIVSSNVPEKSSQLKSKYKIGEFAKQVRTSDFTALGDDYGLLVLVNDKRNWFPTHKLAKAFPSKIIFDTDSEKGLELEII